MSSGISSISDYTHRPWANTFTCRPQLYLQPDTIEQVQAIVKNATKKHINIVVTGATHSPSIITYTSGWLLNLDKLNKVLDVKIDESRAFADVTVQAGARLKYLNDELPKRGFALQNLGSISEQSVAGVISTGTHGSSYCHGLISEQVVSSRLVAESGEILTLSDSENSKLFKAVLLGLGAFGIIVEATSRCVPAFNVESRAYVVDFEALLTPAIWDNIFLESEFHRVWWYPYADKCYVWQGDRTDNPEEPIIRHFSGTKLGRSLYEFLLWVSVRWFPKFTPIAERWIFRRQFQEGVTVRHVGRSDREINMDCSFKQFVNEWSLPLTEGPGVLRRLKREILKEHWFVHSPIEIRASNTTLPNKRQLENLPAHRAPCKGPIYGNISRPLSDPSPRLDYVTPDNITNRQLTLNINATMFRPFRHDPDVTAWYDCFERICYEHGGKPHWAKNFRMNPWSDAKNYKYVTEWKASRDSVSPNHTFGGQEWLQEKDLQ